MPAVRSIVTSTEGVISTVLGRSTLARPKSSVSYSPLFDQPAGVLFLDIETTGLSRYYDRITLIGYQFDGQYHALLADDDPSHFRETLAAATSLVTFNGSAFDLPFLEAAFEGLRWPKHHVDLRYACRRVGLGGGQKEIEKALHIACRDGLEGIDGAMAVILWHRYLRGDVEALRLLIEYNRADIRAMTFILDHVAEAAAPTDLLSRITRLHSFCATPVTRHGLARPHVSLPSPSAQPARSATFDGLFNGTPAETSIVVGLDLTGSEARASGFCVMHGRKAETDLIFEDDEIIRRVLDAAPNLVSIDSPLCLPVGRTKVSDDDPRRFCGIMRQSERVLKKRGINVYPCLIPSMQRLTERGIRLANEIRAHGVPVIECYPGAAQDIMGIPRKGAGIEWLKLGLSEFGVSGPFGIGALSHDELDAITCSLVGFFHLTGRTEALGGKGEEPMIVPDLKASEGIVVGISGPMAAGKTTSARYLERQGFAYTRISEVIEDVLRKRGLPTTRENLQDVGIELHRERGQRWLCRKAIERLEMDARKIVVDGLRWPDDINYLRERFGGQFCHIHIDAAFEVRRARAAHAGHGEEFDRASAHPVEEGVSSVESLAQRRILNEANIQSLETQLAALLTEQMRSINAR